MNLILEYKGKQYTVPQDNWSEFAWTEGEMSCDCNRSRHIKEYADKDFPLLECGEEITLVTPANEIVLR